MKCFFSTEMALTALHHFLHFHAFRMPVVEKTSLTESEGEEGERERDG